MFWKTSEHRGFQQQPKFSQDELKTPVKYRRISSEVFMRNKYSENF